MKVKKINGTIIIQKKVDFEDVIEKKVIKNNNTSCKVNLPKNLEGRTVYILISKEGEDG